MTCDTAGTSRPRAATSVATSDRKRPDRTNVNPVLRNIQGQGNRAWCALRQRHRVDEIAGHARRLSAEQILVAHIIQNLFISFDLRLHRAGDRLRDIERHHDITLGIQNRIAA